MLVLSRSFFEDTISQLASFCELCKKNLLDELASGATPIGAKRKEVIFSNSKIYIRMLINWH